MNKKKSQKHLYKYLLYSILLIWIPEAFAQEFKYEAKLGQVPLEGFYSIDLRPELLSKLKGDLSDIRIYEISKNEEIPYLLQKENGSFDLSYFEEYPIVKQYNVPHRFTSVTIKNVQKSTIDNFCLITQNSDAYKTAKLSGSNDQKNWYVIKENYFLGSLYSDNSVQSEKTISFPLSDYAFFKLDISDSLNDPLLIKKIGCYATRKIESLYAETPKPKISQADSHKLKRSYIRLKFMEPYPIHKFHLTFTGPKFYNRAASLHKVLYDVKGKEYTEVVADFRVFSNADNTIHIPETSAKEYLLTIDNQDNKALALTDFQSYNLKRRLVASFKPQTYYLLKFGDTKLEAPTYDLEYFKDSIPAQPTATTVLTISSIAPKDAPVAPATQWFKNKLWIWISLILVGGLLAYIAVRMVKDLDKRN